MNSATNLERLFKAGILAYQQGDYAQAIAALSSLKTCTSSTYRLKASMGLVRVYMGQQDWPQAKTLCQKIGTSSKPALQQWSQTTLDKIAQRMSVAEKMPAARSGFQPLDERHDLVATKAVSGFHPLTDSDPSGLLNQGAQVTAVAPPALADRSEPTRSKAFPEAAAVSMFHYAYLNGEDAASTAQPQTVQPAEIAPAESTEGLVWPYANRLDKGRALGRIKRQQLWLMQIGGAIAFYYLFRTLIHSAVAVINRFLSFLDDILPFGVGSLLDRLGVMTWPLLILMGVSFVVSPWAWDLWLSHTAGQRPLSMNALRAHSTESATLINRHCRQRRWPFPTLHKLPTDIPLIFSYGFLPRNARLVISQGLLDRLKDDELAALVAYELSHWKSWHWPLLSATTLILQVMLQAHWQLALWANRQKPAIKWVVGAIATLLYGLFWLARLPILGMARVRTYYSDRTAAEITGNPNGLARALTKLSFGLASSVEQQGYTPVLVEGLLPLLPAATDLSRPQAYGHLPLAQLFVWDSQNPLRTWMSLLDSHPPLGDRLRLVMAYAQHWKLAPEIQLAAPPRKKQSLSAQDWRQLWMQFAPYIGLGLGLSIGLLFLGVGAISANLDWPALDWMHKDMGLLNFCWLLGVSIGNIMRINRFFPDLAFSMAPSQDFVHWVGDSELLPASSLPTKLSGQLTGRPGVANWLGQDLMLHTSTGLVKLHFFSVLGPLGNIVNRQLAPRLLYGQSVQVLGWYRRGNRVWLDIDKIRLGNGTLIQAGHPLHSLLLAAIALLTGLWLLIRNSPYA